MISSSIPFPPVAWWVYACKAQTVTFDIAEHYQKMSYRNRYYLAAPEGKLLMSLPLEQGRNQRVAVKEVRLSDRADWQGNHWKTIVSLYGRSPFFEYFEHQFRPLFEQKADRLHEWNIAGIRLVDQVLRLELSFAETEVYTKTYPDDITDLREQFKPQQDDPLAVTPYYQVFEDRTGFLPNCSVLDLLFCEGMHAREILKGF
ncbi:MAG: hypothetical protein EOP49_17400 [Sphingobacteriales bacterium]|nr:MAG: hypothetical protein EOP49_17400 [Sphingobacteriales bacterium]